MKKLISLFLALVMVFSLAVPVMAADETYTVVGSFNDWFATSTDYDMTWNPENSRYELVINNFASGSYEFFIVADNYSVVFDASGRVKADEGPVNIPLTVEEDGSTVTFILKDETASCVVTPPAASGDTNGGITGNNTGDVTANFDPDIAITGISITGDIVTYDETTKTYTAVIPAGEVVDEVYLVFAGTNLNYIPDDDTTYLWKYSYVEEGETVTEYKYLGEEIDAGVCQVGGDTLQRIWGAYPSDIGYTYDLSFSNDGGETWSEPIHYVVKTDLDFDASITGISITGDIVTYDSETNTYTAVIPVGEAVDEVYLVFAGTNLKYIPAHDTTYLLKYSYVEEGETVTYEWSVGENIEYGYITVDGETLVGEWGAYLEDIGFTYDLSFSNDGGETWSEPIHYVVKEDLDIDASITGFRVTGDTVTYDADTNTYTVGIPVGGSIDVTTAFEGTNLKDIPENSYTYLVREDFYDADGELGNHNEATFGQLATMWAFDDTGALSHTFNYGTSVVGTTVAYAYSNNGLAGWSDPVYITFKDAYPITVDTSIENGSVSAKGYALEGETVELFVNADDGYELDELTVTDGEGNGVTVNEDHTFVMPASAVTVNATFKEAATAYTITVDDTIAGGTVTVNGDLTSAHKGDDIILTVTPAEGYKLDAVTVNDGAVEVRQVQGESNQYTFTMPAANVTVTATYTLVEAKWGTSADSLTESGTFAEALAAATAADSTVAYIQLQTNVTTASDNIIPSGVFTLDLNGKTLSSSGYAIVVRNAGTVVTLTDSASGGAVTTSREGCSAVMAEFGAKVVINGGSYSGYYSVLINQSCICEINNGTFHTTDNYAVVASLGSTLTINGGTFSGTLVAVASEGTTIITGGTFEKGSLGHIAYWNGKLDLSGYDANGLTLSQWTNADLTVSSENIVLPVGSTFLDADGKAVATLTSGTVYTIGVETVAEPTYIVDIFMTANGTITADKDTAAEGETVTLTITPDEGYALYSLYINGEEVAVTGNTYQFTMPAKDVVVSSNFARTGKALDTLYVKNTDNWATISVSFYTYDGYLIGDYVTLTLVGGEENIYTTSDIPEFAYKVKISGGEWDSDVIDLPTDGTNQYNPDDGTWTTFVATEQPTVSADIVWGSMAFTYTDESGWANDATDGGTVTVTNTGDSTITAKVAYNALDSYDEITGSFDVESATLDTDDSKTFKLTLEGEPKKAIPAGTKIGYVTVTIE